MKLKTVFLMTLGILAGLVFIFANFLTLGSNFDSQNINQDDLLVDGNDVANTVVVVNTPVDIQPSPDIPTLPIIIVSSTPTSINRPPEPTTCALIASQNGTVLNVRQETDRNSSVIGTLDYGWHPTTGQTVQDARGYSWYPVEIYSSQSGGFVAGFVAGTLADGNYTTLSSACSEPTPLLVCEGITESQLNSQPAYIQEFYWHNCPKLYEILADQINEDIQEVVTEIERLFEECPLTLTSLLGYLRQQTRSQWSIVNARLEVGNACAIAQDVLNERKLTPTLTPSPTFTFTPTNTPTPSPPMPPTPQCATFDNRNPLTPTPAICTPTPNIVATTPVPSEPTLGNQPTQMEPSPSPTLTPSITLTRSISVTISPTPSPTITPTVTLTWPSEAINADGVFLVKPLDNSISTLYIVESGNPYSLSISGNISFPVINYLKRRVVYLLTDENGNISLQMVKLDGGQSAPILVNAFLAEHGLDLKIVPKPVAWSPDGNTLLITLVDSQGVSGIYKFDPFDRILSEKLFDNAEAPAYSPYGEVIVYEGTQDNQIYYVEPDETNVLVDSQSCGRMTSPIFDYDSRLLIFVCQQVNNPSAIYLYTDRGTSAGDAPTQLVIPGVTVFNNLSVLPGGFFTFDDGHKIYIVQLDVDTRSVVAFRTLIEMPSQNAVSMNWVAFPKSNH